MRDVKSPAESVRAERAEVTRRRILQAARRLFAARGYGATTFREIAAEAGVAVQTVYAVFGTKATILAVLRESVVADPAPAAAFAAAVAEPSPDLALALFARSIRLRWEAGHDIVTVNTDAAAVEPAIREAVERVLERRRQGIGQLVRSLQEHGLALPSWERGVAIVDALTLPESYAEFVDVHGWSADEFEAWLARALQRSLGAEADQAAGPPADAGSAGGPRDSGR